MLDWVTEYSTLSRVELEVVAVNKKARRLTEKCGFVKKKADLRTASKSVTVMKISS